MDHEKYAHSLKDRPPAEWQRLDEHLCEVANKASQYADKFASNDWAWNAGWLHDLGKAADEFQAYLLRSNELDDSEYDEAGHGWLSHLVLKAAKHQN
jgi:CRISPR-associated endonuclease Cas3-HD